MTLTESLTTFKTEFRQNTPDSIKETMNQATQDLADSGISDRTLKVGDAIPAVKLPNATGQMVDLQELLKTGPVVISFYRGGWCPYCNLELKALQAHLSEISALGVTLVAISPETPDASLSTAEKNALEFAVLSDVGNQVARNFGLVFTLPESLRSLYSQFGIDIPAHNGDDTFELPIPATYVVNTDGAIALAFAEVDYTLRLDPTEIVAALQKLATA